MPLVPVLRLQQSGRASVDRRILPSSETSIDWLWFLELAEGFGRVWIRSCTYKDQNVGGVSHLLPEEHDHQHKDVPDDAEHDNDGEDDRDQPGDDQVELSLAARRGVVLGEVRVGKVGPLVLAGDVEVQVIEGPVGQTTHRGDGELHDEVEDKIHLLSLVKSVSFP